MSFLISFTSLLAYELSTSREHQLLPPYFDFLYFAHVRQLCLFLEKYLLNTVLYEEQKWKKNIAEAKPRIDIMPDNYVKTIWFVF